MGLQSGSIVFLLGLFACDGGPADPDQVALPIGDVAVFLSPEGGLDHVPDSVDAIWLQLEDVLVHHGDHGWVPVGRGREEVELLAMRGERRVPIGVGPVYEGAYDALHVDVTDAWIVVDGVELDLALAPSVGLTPEAVEFRGAFVVETGATTTLILPWDLDLRLREGRDGWSLAADLVTGAERDAG